MVDNQNKLLKINDYVFVLHCNKIGRISFIFESKGNYEGYINIKLLSGQYISTRYYDLKKLTPEELTIELLKL